MNSPMLYGYSFGCESLMADRTGLGSTTLPGSKAGYGKCVHSKVTLTYLGKLTTVYPGECLSRRYHRVGRLYM